MGIKLPPLLTPREAVRKMAPYSPPTAGRADKLRLDFNENTVGCSPAVAQFLRERISESGLSVYPEYVEAKKELTAYFGVAEDDGVVMATYLGQLFKERTPRSAQEVRDIVVEAGMKRIRPCLMTTATTVIGLMPVFLAEGRGSDVMQPMAIPSVGGMAIQLITLFVVPCVYCLVEEWKLRRRDRDGGA